MKIFIHKFIAVCLVITILTSLPMFAFAQQKLLGDLSITKNAPEGFVTVNGEQVISGRSITSSSLIVTSPKASAIVSLPNTGRVSISPNSKLNLSFITSSISADITSGEIIVQTMPNTSLNISMPDGNLTLPTANQENIIKIEVLNSRTTVRTLAGKAQFNNVLVSAGEYFPLNSGDDASSNKRVQSDDDKSKSYNPILIIALAGAVGAIALIALSGSSDNDDVPILSPTR